jgi:uncharacterized protein YegL
MGFFCGLFFLLVVCSAEKKGIEAPGYSFGTGGTRGDEQPASGSPGETGNGGVSNVGRGGTSSSSGGKGGDSTKLGGEVCADVSITASRATPWVLFVIDRSSSMDQTYDGTVNRSQAIYSALMDPNDGVIAKLESVAYFGVVLFDGTDPCPNLIQVKAALNNYKAIDAVYKNAGLGMRTPTALALNAAYGMVPSKQQVLDNPGLGKQFVVLCTDGEPNGCAGANMGGADFEGPTTEVTNAAAAGIKTYVVSVASGGPDYQNFLDNLAKIGNTGSAALSPATKDELTKQLNDIVGKEISCAVELKTKKNGEGIKVSEACRGKVYLDSKEIECNGADGWKLTDETHIELQGKSCNSFKSNGKSILNGTFPCDVVVVK